VGGYWYDAGIADNMAFSSLSKSLRQTLVKVRQFRPFQVVALGSEKNRFDWVGPVVHVWSKSEVKNNKISILIDSNQNALNQKSANSI
jgi:hypothetical protein